MIKQSLIYLLLSMIIVIFAEYAQLLIVYTDILYNYVNFKLMILLDGSATQIIARQVLALVLIPVTLTTVPAISYKIIRKQAMPYFQEITWFLWLIVILSKILIQ
ncbi:MAG: hypothetical protein ACOVQX_03795 [Legionella sp.]